MNSLSRQLDGFLAGLLDRTDPRTAEALRRLQDAHGQSVLVRHALTTGARAPDFTLVDQYGQAVSLSERLAAGPVVLTFFRGGWCPFCSIALRSLQSAAGRIERCGASLLAVTPQAADGIVAMADSHGLTLPILSDRNNEVARSYGLVWQLDAAEQEIYRRLGHDLPAINGAAAWELPMPAGYVIAQDGRICHARVDARVTHRLEPAEALGALEALRADPVG